ncbi:hypothetical protein IJ556_00710, partial [bacterium]|nr:hypothetical protein [bacterium]
EPLVVYHGTRPNLAGFTVFDTDDEKGNGSIFGKNHGSFFTDKIEVARSYGEDIYPVFLNIRTPDIYNFNGRLWSDYGLVEGRSTNVMYSKNYSETTHSLAYLAKTKQDIDGASFLNVIDMGFGAVFSDKKLMSNVWVVFNPEQIKSATDNIGTFDRQNPDIRFDLFGLPENDIATIEKDLRIAKCLQGEPVAVLNDRLAPHTGMADIRKWANGVFNAWGNHAVNPELGEIVLDNKSVKNTLGHKISPFKVEAIRSIKEVIEQGVVVSSTQVRREEHFFISAPVTIENKEDIVTVLVKRNRDTQRMYLHSVMVKESILQKNFEQENATEYLDRNADTEVSEPNPKLYSGDIGRILQKYLKVNISELEKELKIMENQQIEQQTTQPESELKNWIEKNGFQYSFSGIDAKVFLHRDNELIRLIVADDNRNIQLVNTSNIYKKISYDWQNTLENFAKLDNDFQTMKDSFKIIANLNEYTATQGGVFLSNTQSEKENTMNTENDTIFKFNNGYTITISDKLEQQVRKQG